jgi:ribosome biogenesis GTPase
MLRCVGTGETGTLVGLSGAGKSTLINAMVGSEVLATGAVRDFDSKGRQTTTHRELIVLPAGGLLIDNPGMRELELWGDEADLQGAFADITELAAQCRFHDCSHAQEPGCAVRAALSQGVLDHQRFQSYLKLQKELGYLAKRREQTPRVIEKERWKQIAKSQRVIQKSKRK